MLEKKATIIISYCKRKYNLTILLNYLNFLTDYEIIIVEMDNKTTLNLKNYRHIFIKSGKPFNKSLCYNIGAKYAACEKLIFIDTDILIKKYCFEEGLEKLNEYDIYKPYEKIIYFDKKDTDLFHKYKNTEKFDFNKKSKIIKGCVISGGAFFINKKSYLEIGGFDENIFGYGYEDVIFDLFINELQLKVYYNKDNCVHTWHPENNRNWKLIKKNKDRYIEYISFSKDEMFEIPKNVISDCL